MKKLLRLARNASQRAYSPYSGICVGAAVMDESGREFTGANIENASYSLTLCAERVAISTAVAAGATQIVALAVALHSDSAAVEKFCPCGACLQFLAEFASDDALILIENLGEFGLKDLLGAPFVIS